MAKRAPTKVGGLSSMKYTFRMAKKSGNVKQFVQRLRSRNTCKACALGMSGMKNERGEGLQVCKKSMQATMQDMQPALSEQFFKNHSIEELKRLSGRDLEASGRLVFPVVA
ncbi:MAG: histidine kinase, partial [Candidatus Heimdallarchaeota archaeon]|nr:histidine kinase [Candidatus Heimdallarchaeota archaeon]